MECVGGMIDGRADDTQTPFLWISTHVAYTQACSSPKRTRPGERPRQHGVQGVDFPFVALHEPLRSVLVRREADRGPVGLFGGDCIVCDRVYV